VSSPFPSFEGLGRQHRDSCSGVRAFGTQLLCEQVIGRALRRQSYDLNEEVPSLMWNMPM